MDIESAARRIREDGYTVVPDFLGEEMLDGLRRDLAPLFEAIGSRMTEDYGRQTIHTHNLLAKTRAVDEILMDDRLLGLVEAVLGPDYQISGVAAMRPGPGDRRQRMHQDDGHYPIPRPRRGGDAREAAGADRLQADQPRSWRRGLPQPH